MPFRDNRAVVVMFPAALRLPLVVVPVRDLT